MQQFLPHVAIKLGCTRVGLYCQAKLRVPQLSFAIPISQPSASQRPPRRARFPILFLLSVAGVKGFFARTQSKIASHQDRDALI